MLRRIYSRCPLGDWVIGVLGLLGRLTEQIVYFIMDAGVVHDSRTARVTWVKISNTGA